MLVHTAAAYRHTNHNVASMVISPHAYMSFLRQAPGGDDAPGKLQLALADKAVVFL